MTLETGDKSGSRESRRGGFTLVEILLVITLFAVLAGVVINNVDQLLVAVEVIPAERRFRDIVTEARLLAVEKRMIHRLSFNSDSGRFVLLGAGTRTGSTAGEVEEDPFASVSPSEAEYRYDGLQVNFFPVPSSPSSGDPGDPETVGDPIEWLEFHPSGASTAARVEFVHPDASPVTLTVEPFSAGPLPSRMENGGGF